MLTRQSILLQVKITFICKFSIIYIQIMTKLEIPLSLFREAYFEKFWEQNFFTLTSFFLGQYNPVQRISLKSESGWCPFSIFLGDLTENVPTIICIFSIIHIEITTKLETPLSLSGEGILSNVLGFEISNSNKLLFRIKQPYTLNYTLTQVRVVTHPVWCI